MPANSLLTKDEKGAFVPKPVQIIQAAAVVRLYVAYPNPNKWLYTGLAGAMVLSLDTQAHTFFFKLIDVVSKQGILWDQEIHSGFTYNQDRTFFHSFELDKCMVGFSFADETEAGNFFQKTEYRDNKGSGSPAKSGLAKISSRFRGAFKVEKSSIGPPQPEFYTSRPYPVEQLQDSRSEIPLRPDHQRDSKPLDTGATIVANQAVSLGFTDIQSESHRSGVSKERSNAFNAVSTIFPSSAGDQQEDIRSKKPTADLEKDVLTLGSRNRAPPPPPPSLPPSRTKGTHVPHPPPPPPPPPPTAPPSRARLQHITTEPYLIGQAPAIPEKIALEPSTNSFLKPGSQIFNVPPPYQSKSTKKLEDRPAPALPGRIEHSNSTRSITSPPRPPPVPSRQGQATAMRAGPTIPDRASLPFVPPPPPPPPPSRLSVQHFDSSVRVGGPVTPPPPPPPPLAPSLPAANNSEPAISRPMSLDVSHIAGKEDLMASIRQSSLKHLKAARTHDRPVVVNSGNSSPGSKDQKSVAAPGDMAASLAAVLGDRNRKVGGHSDNEESDDEW